MKKLLIPIDIKSEKDLPENEGNYLIENKNSELFRIDYRNTLRENNEWVKYLKFWYKEVSEEEYNKELEYWHERCLLAEDCINENPCELDITKEQITAHLKWQNKIKEGWKFLENSGLDKPF